MRTPISVYLQEYKQVIDIADTLYDKLHILMLQMEEGKEEFAIEDPAISKEYEDAYDILEQLATNVSIEIEDFKNTVKKGMGESNG